MPNNNVYTEEYLRSWYQNFSNIMKEQFLLDVTRVEDIGRIKNYFINSWGETDPAADEIRIVYPYVPRNGQQYNVPAPTNLDNKSFFMWLRKNLNTEVSIDQIRELHAMSQAGTLVATQPGEAMTNASQVVTDSNGNITVMPKLSCLENETYPEGTPDNLKCPPAPRYIAPPANPETFGVQGAPKRPQPPRNTNPGFFSRLGYFLGMDTDYAKLVRYQTYPKRLNDWLEAHKNEPGVADYAGMLKSRQNYENAYAEYKKHPMAVGRAFTGGFRAAMMGYPEEVSDWAFQLAGAETQQMLEEHVKTPMGKLTGGRKEAERKIEAMALCDRVLDSLLGPEVKPIPEYMRIKPYPVYNVDQYKGVDYQVPTNPKLCTQEQLNALAPLACYAAILDPSVGGTYPRKNRSPEESAELLYSHILNDIFTEGRTNSHWLTNYVSAARPVGLDALTAYAEGDPTKLGQLLGNSIRQTCRESNATGSIRKTHTINTNRMIGKLLGMLDEHPELMANCGLSQDELQQARANVAYGNMIIRGYEAQKMIMEHSQGLRTLAPAELKEAARDILFMNIIGNQSEAESAAYANQRDQDPDHMKVAEQNVESAMKHVEARAAYEAALKNNAPNVAELKAEVDKQAEIHEYTEGYLNLADLRRPTNNSRMMLLNQDAVNKAKDDLMNSKALENLHTMDRAQLGKIFQSASDVVSAIGKANLPAVKPPVANAAKQHQLTGNDAPQQGMNMNI